jgi:hypothetical protein
MIVRPPFRLAARIGMHLPAGFTQVVLFETSYGGHRWVILTDKIPPHLRQIGSEVLVISPRFTPESEDSADDIREMCRRVQVEELNRA